SFTSSAPASTARSRRRPEFRRSSCLRREARTRKRIRDVGDLEVPLMRRVKKSLITAAVILALSLAAAVRAQQKQTPGDGGESAPKVQIGAQYSKIRFGDVEPSPAFAGFVTYNLTGHLSVDAEAYFFPFKILGDGYVVSG